MLTIKFKLWCDKVNSIMVLLYSTGFFSNIFRQIEQMDLPESWVILTFLELFCKNPWVILAEMLELFWLKCMSYFGCKFKAFGSKNLLKPWVISQKEFFFQNLELFSLKNPWVILEMLKKKPALGRTIFV